MIIILGRASQGRAVRDTRRVLEEAAGAVLQPPGHDNNDNDNNSNNDNNHTNE